MSASMNGSINLSIEDGWVGEFARHGHNAFVLPVTDSQLAMEKQDEQDSRNLLDMLENEVLPLYYRQPERWFEMMKTTMKEIVPAFDSERMADEYYRWYEGKLP
jgi:starch phosphorylase